MAEPTLEQQLAALEAASGKVKASFAEMGKAAQAGAAAMNDAFKKASAGLAGLAPLLAEPEIEPESVPAGLEPPAPVAEVAASRLQEAAAGLGAPRAADGAQDRQNGSHGLGDELEEVPWTEAEKAAHPRWPAGTPGGLGGQFMHVGQRFKIGDVWYDVDQVLPGGVYAHVATRGKHGKAAYVWIPAKPKKKAEGVVHEIPGVEKPPAEVVIGEKKMGGKYGPASALTQTVIDPYVHDDHDPTIPIPPESPPELTPERWARFGRADQMRYTDLMKEFGSWQAGKAQGLVDHALSQQADGAVKFVLESYHRQFGQSTGFTISLISKFQKHLPGGAEKQQAALEKTFRDYEEAKMVQDKAARAIQWDLYNRTKSPDIAIFHKSTDSASWWKESIISGDAPIFAGLSQTQHYRVGGFGHVAVATPVAIRNIVMATTAADVYKGHGFHGEQEVSLRDPASLDARSLVFDDGNISSASSWLGKVTNKGHDGTVIDLLREYMTTGDVSNLPIPPEPANITSLGEGGIQTWTPPPDSVKKGIGAWKYADVDANGAPLAKPANTLELKPGDVIEGMKGTRYIIVEDKGDEFGIRYYKVTNEGTEQPDGSFTGHEDFLGEECYTFESAGVKPFKKLSGHVELPAQAVTAKKEFVQQAWSETAADAGKLVGQLEPGTKFVVGGIPYQIEAKLPGGQVKIENLQTGGLAQINGTYKTPWLVLKAGYTEKGVPAFQASDYFVHEAAPLSELKLKPGDLFYAGAKGDAVWQVADEGMVKGKLHVHGVSAGNEGKLDVFEGTMTARRVEAKPPGWMPAAVGDTLAIDGKKGEVTKLLAGGVVQVNLKPGVVKLKPDDPRLVGLFRPEGHNVGEKMKLRDFGVGEKFHGGSGNRVRPYIVLEQNVPRGKGKPKGVRVRNLDTGEEMVMPNTRNYARLNPKGTSQPEPGAPKHTPVDHGSVFDPNAWKVGTDPVATSQLAVGDKLKAGSGYFEVTADKGAAWEWKDLLTGEHVAFTKGSLEVLKLEPSGVVPVTAFDPGAYVVGDPKPLSELKKGDIFQGTKKGKHYVVKTTGAKSGLSAMDLETGKVSSPWSYDKVAPVLEPKAGDSVQYEDLEQGDATTLAILQAGDQFEHNGQVLEVVEPYTNESENITAAPVVDGALGFPNKIGHYPGLLVTYHKKEPPPPPEAPPAPTEIDTSSLPPFSGVEAFSPKSKTGGGYVFTKAKNAAEGTVLKDKDGLLYKVVQAGADPVVSDGHAHGILPGELNLKVVEEPFVDNVSPGAGPELATPKAVSAGGPGAVPAGAKAALNAVAASKGPSDWADNHSVKLELEALNPGDVWAATSMDVPHVYLGPVPGDDALVYSQNLDSGAIVELPGTGVPDLVSPGMPTSGTYWFEQANFGGWVTAGTKAASQLEPGDYYRPFGEAGVTVPSAQVIDNKGGVVVIRALRPGIGMGDGEPIEVTIAGNVEVFEPIPVPPGLLATPTAGDKVFAGSLQTGEHLETGGGQGFPAGVYEVIPWSLMPENVAQAKGKYGVPPTISVVSDVVWMKHTGTGEIAWVSTDLQVTPVGAPVAGGAPSADPDDYDDVGAYTQLGDLEPGEFFKSAQGSVWQVVEKYDTQVKVTKLDGGKEAWGASSMPTNKVVPKAGAGPEIAPAGGLEIGDTVTWLTPNVGGGKWGKVIGFEEGKPSNVKVQVEGESTFYVVGADKLAKAWHGGRPHDPADWEPDVEVPAHELEPGDKFVLSGEHWVVEEGPPPVQLGDKYGGDPDWGWVTSLESGKSVAYKNSPGETGDKGLMKLKPKPGAEVAAPGGGDPVFSAGEQMFSAENEPLIKGKTVWLTGPNAGVAVIPKGSGNEPGTVQVEFDDGSTAPYPPGALTTVPPGGQDPEELAPNQNGVTVAELDVGDHFLSKAAVLWKIEHVDHPSNTVTAVSVKDGTMHTFPHNEVPLEVPQGKEFGGPGLDDDFGPPPPGHDLVPNDAGVKVRDLMVGDRLMVDGLVAEIESFDPLGGDDGLANVFNPLSPSAKWTVALDDVPEQVPAYKLPPATLGIGSLEKLALDVEAKGPLPQNSSGTKVKDLPVGTLVQEEPAMIASGISEGAVWRITGKKEGGGVQAEIVVPAAGGYPVGQQHVWEPGHVFGRALTPQAKATADALDVPYVPVDAPGAAQHIPGSPPGAVSKSNQGGEIRLGDLKKGDLFAEAQGGWWRVTSKKGAKKFTAQSVDQFGVTGAELEFNKNLAPEWVPPKAAPKKAKVEAALIYVPPNDTGAALGALPVGTLVQDAPTESFPHKPAVWKIAAKGHFVTMEVVEPSGGESPYPVGTSLEFDADKVFPRVFAPEKAAPAGEPGTIGALEPGDHFLKGGQVYLVGLPTPGMEGSHVKAIAVGPKAAGAGYEVAEEVDYPVGTQVVKVPPPASKFPPPFPHAAQGEQVPGTVFAAGDKVTIQPGGGADDVGKTGTIAGFGEGWIDVEFEAGGTFENGGLGRFMEHHLQLAPAAGAGPEVAAPEVELGPFEPLSDDELAPMAIAFEEVRVGQRFKVTKAQNGDTYRVVGTDPTYGHPLVISNTDPHTPYKWAGMAGDPVWVADAEMPDPKTEYAQAPPPATIEPFQKLKASELTGQKEPVADMPIGVRFKLTQKANETYRVVGQTPEGAILVVRHDQLKPWEFSLPDASAYRADVVAVDDMPPTKDWVEFSLGEEAWTLGGKHGHFESPESGPSAHEKVFLIDGDPVPKQFMGHLYIADPIGDVGPAAPAGPAIPDKLPANAGEIHLGDLPLGTLVQEDPSPGSQAAGVWRVVAKKGAGVQVEMVKDGVWEDGTPYGTPIGHKQNFAGDMVFARVMGPAGQGGYGLAPLEQKDANVVYPVGQLAVDDVVQYEGEEWVVHSLDGFGATLEAGGDMQTLDLDDPVEYLGPLNPPPPYPDKEAQGEFDTLIGDLPVGAEFETVGEEKWVVTDTTPESTTAEPIGQEGEGLEQVWKAGEGDEMVAVLSWGPEGPHGEPSLAGGEPGDRIVLGGQPYTITADAGDGYEVEDEQGNPAGTISKWNEKATLEKLAAKVEADEEAGGDVLKPYSQKSKSGGGYYFADLGDMEPGDEFTDKTGTIYVVKGKTADGYYVRFRPLGDPGAVYSATAGTRVKLPLSSK